MSLSIEDAVKLVGLFGKQTDEQLAVARTIADAAIAEYGDFSPAEWAHVTKHGIWNDHVSVQASLATLQLFRPLIEALSPIIDSVENTVIHDQVERLCLPISDLANLVEVYRGAKHD